MANIKNKVAQVPYMAIQGHSPLLGSHHILKRVTNTSAAAMGVYTFAQYFRDQWNQLPIPKPIDDVHSKTFLVTGSNVGLGFEASIHIANMRPKVLVATSRDEAKCEKTLKSIFRRATANGLSKAQLLSLPLELGSFESVRAFVDKFVAHSNGELNVLVANAGICMTTYTVTEDGWEAMLQVNYLSTALLSILLLPYLINSSTSDSPSRLVIVSSFAQYFNHLKDIDSWNNILATINNPDFVDTHRYAVSKLLEVMFIRELASRLPEPTPVITCTVNPGFCKSAIFRGVMGEWMSFIVSKLFFLRSTEEGSRTLVHAAVATDRSVHGRYLSCCQVTEEDDFIFMPRGKVFSADLWDETIMLLNRIDGRVSEIVEKYLRADG